MESNAIADSGKREKRSYLSRASRVEPLYAAGLGLLGAASFPPLGLWPLALVSIALFLRLLAGQSWRAAGSLGLVYGLVYALGTMHWLFRIFALLAFPLVGLMAAYFGLLAVLIALTKGHKPLVRAALVALCAVAVDWLRGDAWYLRFPWYTAPHALAAAPAWIAPARWLGVYGLTFAVWLIAGWGAFGRARNWAAFLTLPACSFLLPAVEPPDRRALLVQGEGTLKVEAVISRVPAEKVDLAVLPEYAYAVSPAAALKSSQGPALLARKLSCPVVFGAVENKSLAPAFDNVAAVIDAKGEILGTFPKQRPLPLFRDGVPGTRRPVFELEQGVLGVAICYDFDAPEIAASLARSGATVFVDPTFDAMSWGWSQHVNHELLLRLRAVENDRWILRPASSGRSETVNPHGVPSEEGIGIGENDYIILGYGHRRTLPPGGQLHALGPGAAAAVLVLILLHGLRTWRKRVQVSNGLPERGLL